MVGGTRYSQYVIAWKERFQREEFARERRARRALSVARRIALLLRRRWGAEHVYLFGSLARHVSGKGGFGELSDIDLAVTGLSDQDFYAIYGRILRLSSFPVDLVSLESASNSMVRRVAMEGVELGGGQKGSGSDKHAAQRDR